MAVHLTDLADLKKLSRHLSEYLPKSIQIYNRVKNAAEEKWPWMQFVVDEWPNFGVVVGMSTVVKDNNDTQAFVFFSRGKDRLLKFLDTNERIDWKKKVYIHGTVKEDMDVIEFWVTRNVECSCLTKACDVYFATDSTYDLSDVRADLILSQVNAGLSNVIAENWKYGDDSTPQVITTLIERMRSMCIHLTDGQLVGYVLEKQDGSIGMLYVSPQFRRRGYATVLMTSFAKEMQNTEKCVYVMLDKDNVISKLFHEKLGFVKSQMEICWGVFVPKQDGGEHKVPICCQLDNIMCS